MNNYNFSHSSGDSVDFSDAEIKNELSRLGYHDIDEEQFDEFKRDLLTLVNAERSSSFSSVNSHTPYPRNTHSSKTVGQLYEPLSNTGPPTHQDHYREKENPERSTRPYRLVQERQPLRSAPSNITPNTKESSPLKAYKHYSSGKSYSRSEQYSEEEHYSSGKHYSGAAVSHSLPRHGKPAEYYEPVEGFYVRPQSADGFRRYPDVYEDTTDKHLDDYWYGKGDRGHLMPGKPLPSDSQDYTTASELSQHPKDDDLADSLADKLNLSKASQSSVIKRKVSRKLHDGSSDVYEESYVQGDSHCTDDSDAASDSEVSDRGGQVKPSYINYTSTHHPGTGSGSIGRTSRTAAISARYDKSVDPVRSAVIWPEVRPVVSRNMVKTDPVSRYQSYQQEWAKSKVPEEKKHKELRWAVREQMLYKDVIYEKPQKKFVANKYVVPTDKKRKDLRWRIRADMNAGILPKST